MVFFFSFAASSAGPSFCLFAPASPSQPADLCPDLPCSLPWEQRGGGGGGGGETSWVDSSVAAARSLSRERNFGCFLRRRRRRRPAGTFAACQLMIIMIIIIINNSNESVLGAGLWLLTFTPISYEPPSLPAGG